MAKDVREDSSPGRSRSGRAPGGGRKTAGGILLPDTAKQKPQRGRVAAVGAGKLRDRRQARLPCRSPSATRLFMAVRAERTSRSSNKELKILRESDILAKIVK